VITEVEATPSRIILHEKETLEVAAKPENIGNVEVLAALHLIAPVQVQDLEVLSLYV
jgi:hypothetical protein